MTKSAKENALESIEYVKKYLYEAETVLEENACIEIRFEAIANLSRAGMNIQEAIEFLSDKIYTEEE